MWHKQTITPSLATITFKQFTIRTSKFIIVECKQKKQNAHVSSRTRPPGTLIAASFIAPLCPGYQGLLLRATRFVQFAHMLRYEGNFRLHFLCLQEYEFSLKKHSHEFTVQLIRYEKGWDSGKRELNFANPLIFIETLLEICVSFNYMDIFVTSHVQSITQMGNVFPYCIINAR